MNINNPVIKLCQQGTEDEYHHKQDEACAKYHQAWVTAASDYEACIAAHYVARCQSSTQDELQWNLIALKHALQSNEEIAPFLGSLYVNIAHSYEKLGDLSEAGKYYLLASSHGVNHLAE
jgi:hypothetical protein